MTGRGAGLAAMGLAASALVHAGAFWALAAMVAPERIPPQSLPESRLDIAPQNVPRGDAAALPPEAEALGQIAGDAGAVRQGTIARAEAVAVVPEVQRVAAAAPGATPLAPAPPQPDMAVAVARPAAATPVPAKAARIVPSQASVAPLDPAQAPALRVASATPTAQDAAFAVPDQPVVGAAVPQTVDAVARPLPETRQTAALAWSGSSGDAGPIAPASLAAIAAFTRPQDARSDAGEVRDGIAGILASVPCARLQTVFDPQTGTLVIRGHIPEDALRGPITRALSAQVGGSIPVSDQLLILPRPQCAALAGIAAIGLPQSTEQLTNPRVIGAEGFARTYTYTNGQRLELELQAPDYPGFIYVDYFTADGMVIHLQPNDIVPLQAAVPKSAQSVGKAVANQPFLDLTIGPPFGQEIAAAFAASHPLYDGLRPLQEPAEPYLAYLRERVARTRAAHADFKGEWVYFFVSTVPG